MDSVIEFVKQKAEQNDEVKKLVLFGSRARGDNKSRSDYDIAVIAPKLSREHWVNWHQDLLETVPTLCGLDLILIDDETSPSLKKVIDQEGIIIYEKN